MAYSGELGINTYGLGGLLSRDFTGTLQNLKETGISGLEICLLFSGCPSPVNRVLRLALSLSPAHGGIWVAENGSGAGDLSGAAGKITAARKAGFAVRGAHIMCLSLTDRVIQDAVRFAEEEQLSYYVVYFMTDSLSKAEKLLPALKKAAGILKDHGIALLLHNHDCDLRPDRDGRCVFEYFLEKIPELQVELDLGWAQFAGRDPLELMEKYKDRIRMLHFKDVRRDASRAERSICFSAVGEGSIPMEGILKKAEELSLFPGAFCIDQDASPDDLMSDIRKGAEHIRKAEHVDPQEGLTGKGPLPLSLMTFPLAGDMVLGKLPFEKVCQEAASYQLPSLDMMDTEILFLGKQRVKQTLEKYGLQLNCLIATIPMTLLPESLVRRSIRKNLKTASDLHSPLLMIVPMPQWQTGLPGGGSDAEGPAREKQVQKCIRYLTYAVQEAEAYHIRVCVEDTPTCLVPLCSTGDCRRILKAVPGLGLVYDTANMIPCEDDPVSFYEELKEYICYVHLKDVKLTDRPNTDRCRNGKYLEACVWGQGAVPVRDLYDRLVRDGYKGNCAIEFVPPSGRNRFALRDRIGEFLKALPGFAEQLPYRLREIDNPNI